MLEVATNLDDTIQNIRINCSFAVAIMKNVNQGCSATIAPPGGKKMMSPYDRICGVWLAAFRSVGYSLVERSWEYTAAAARFVFTFLSYVINY